MSSCPRLARPALLLASLALGLAACDPPPPPGSDFVGAWQAITGSVTASLPADEVRRARARAFASLAMFEGYAADAGTGLRSLGGQVNGLWSVPAPVSRVAVDGAIVAAEAQRVLLDSLASANPGLRAAVDSLARSQLTARRDAGVVADVAERSLRHGALVGRTVLALASADAPRTFVLRHPAECALAPQGAPYPVTAQGEPAEAVRTPAPAPLARDLAESLVLEAMERADALAASRAKFRLADPPYDCVAQRIRGRLRTRAASR